MKKLTYLCTVFCLTFFSLFVNSCDFHFEDDKARRWFMDNKEEHIYIDEREGIKQVTQDISIPSANQTIESMHYASYTLDINNPGWHYAIYTNKYIEIEILKYDGSLITKYPSYSPKGFTCNDGQVIVKIINKSSNPITIDKLGALSAIPEDYSGNVFETTASYRNSGEVLPSSYSLGSLGTLPANALYSYCLYLPTQTTYNIDVQGSGNLSNVYIKLTYFMGDPTDNDVYFPETTYYAGSAQSFSNQTPPSGYSSSPVRLEIINYDSSDVYISNLVVSSSQGFSQPSLEFRYGW